MSDAALLASPSADHSTPPPPVPEAIGRSVETYRQLYNQRLLIGPAMRTALLVLCTLIASLGALRYGLTWWWVAAPGLAAIAGQAGWEGLRICRRWLSLGDATRELDRRLHLKERLVTSLQWADVTARPRLYDTLLADLQRQLQDTTTARWLPRRMNAVTYVLIALALALLAWWLWPASSAATEPAGAKTNNSQQETGGGGSAGTPNTQSTGGQGASAQGGGAGSQGQHGADGQATAGAQGQQQSQGGASGGQSASAGQQAGQSSDGQGGAQGDQTSGAGQGGSQQQPAGADGGQGASQGQGAGQGASSTTAQQTPSQPQQPGGSQGSAGQSPQPSAGDASGTQQPSPGSAARPGAENAAPQQPGTQTHASSTVNQPGNASAHDAPSPGAGPGTQQLQGDVKALLQQLSQQLDQLKEQPPMPDAKGAAPGTNTDENLFGQSEAPPSTPPGAEPTPLELQGDAATTSSPARKATGPGRADGPVEYGTRATVQTDERAALGAQQAPESSTSRRYIPGEYQQVIDQLHR